MIKLNFSRIKIQFCFHIFIRIPIFSFFQAFLNGSRLGKEFSANVFYDLLNNTNKQRRNQNTIFLSMFPNNRMWLLIPREKQLRIFIRPTLLQSIRLLSKAITPDGKLIYNHADALIKTWSNFFYPHKLGYGQYKFPHIAGLQGLGNSRNFTSKINITFKIE
jgi:hypothetical protein